MTFADAPVVEAEGLTRHYTLPRERLTAAPQRVFALNQVSLTVRAGRSLGVVGESGCGKSTLARCVMALEPLTAGTLHILGKDPHVMRAWTLRRHRRNFQMVFQDPFGSLDPRHTVGRIVAEPLDVAEKWLKPDDRRGRVREVLESVGLKEADMSKYPHEFSGGQRQRVAIARALVTRPALIVADEPVSALDVSVQAQVLNLLQDLQDLYGVTYLLISHDLAVVKYVCHEVAVMYLGRIVEYGPTEGIFTNATHPYTRALLDAVPKLSPSRRRARSALKGMVPDPTETNPGCPFADRCPLVESQCRSQAPELREVAPGHVAACHLV
ncbi:MAG: ATP-binding cassette domain-containing protein [Alphaproteobacteria bacterium]|nr:ATP-binding cassette domain-containing protein [Alphaproteobacteria bacterium]MCY4498335.1 ATP-binding cassette domain-containing protein [Rhodospirillaceae bacterium]